MSKVPMPGKRRIVYIDYGFKCDACGQTIHGADKPEEVGWTSHITHDIIQHLCPADHSVDLRGSHG